jgi:hypothetical protein
VNAAFLIMSSAALAGADPAPTPPPPAAPVVVSGTGCSNCGAPAYSGCCGSSKVSFWDRLKSRFSGFGKKRHSCECAPAPACNTCAPAPVYTYAPAPAAACDTCGCGASRPNLFDRLKERWGSKKHACGPTCDACSASAYPATPVAPAPGSPTPPDKMPAPPEKKPGANASYVPQPMPGVSLVGNSPY